MKVRFSDEEALGFSGEERILKQKQHKKRVVEEKFLSLYFFLSFEYIQSTKTITVEMKLFLCFSNFRVKRMY